MGWSQALKIMRTIFKGQDMRIFITEDGYTFDEVEGARGCFTDGDIEFQLPTDMVGMIWDCVDGQYCADGDGIVVVAHDGNQWIVTDQGDPVDSSDSLVVALCHGMRQLRNHYPEVYENFFGEQE